MREKLDDDAIVTSHSASRKKSIQILRISSSDTLECRSMCFGFPVSE